MKVNYVFNLINQISTAVIGLLLTAYISRALGVDTFGYYSYIITIVNLVILFANFGIGSYGPKIIAEFGDSMSSKFNDLYSFQITTTFISLVIVVVVMLVSNTENYAIWIIEIFYILFTALNPSWFFVGIKNLKYNMVISLFTQMLNLILVLLIVKLPEDLLTLLVILALISIIKLLIPSIIINVKYCRFKFNISNFKILLPQITMFFLPMLITSIYIYSDKILIANLSTIDQVGIYNSAVTLVKATLILSSSLNAVIMPLISSNVNNIEFHKETLKMATSFAIYTSFLIITCLIVFAKPIVLILFGESYIQMVPLIILLAPIVLLISFGNIIFVQYIIGIGKNRINIKINSIGAIINILMNIILIPTFGAIGAAIATTSTELLVTIWGFRIVKDVISNKYVALLCTKLCFPTILSIILCYLISLINIPIFILLILQALCIIVVYSSSAFLIDMFSKEKYLYSKLIVAKQKFVK